MLEIIVKEKDQANFEVIKDSFDLKALDFFFVLTTAEIHKEIYIFNDGQIVIKEVI